ncbi:MAG: hypothetical protein JXR46_04455 [Calditrichaceae bacterium]|nr:hypothetical protein [Calditrichaceae bacterium]MBN2708278.1 hypothetical protein [Calditrichaceae bacterium]RQV91921.1 MAG: hypothetical protein EH224_16965 [Calditrichota bacterium]
MQRKEFLKSACSMGLCSCVGLAAFTPSEIHAQEEKNENKEVEQLNKKMDFIHKRFAKLVEILKENVPEDKRKKIFEELGMACSGEYKGHYSKYVNNIDGFISEVMAKWEESVNHDKNKKTITIIGKKMDNCYCALADKAVTPGDFCDCSLGWQKGIYEYILGKKVKVTVDESILRGGERCSFTIKYI